MNSLKLKRIIYLIAFTGIVTIGIQVYRNIQNYNYNKQRVINEIQQSLDVGIEAYYVQRTKNEVVKIIPIDSLNPPIEINSSNIQVRTGKRGILKKTVRKDSSEYPLNSEISKRTPKTWIDSQSFTFQIEKDHSTSRGDSLLSQLSIDTFRFNPELDSGHTIKSLIHKVFISLREDTLNMSKINDYIETELSRKNIDIPYVLLLHETDSVKKNPARIYPFSTESNTTFLHPNQRFEINFANPAIAILKRGAVDFMISVFIIIAVLGSLIYLYKIISTQKALSEIKNDLISNITHEFKTPIATISTAVEGISNFNDTNDPNKTNRYLDISKSQLLKLNGMVEKLLETATLDSDDLSMGLEDVEAVSFTQQIYNRYQTGNEQKNLKLYTETEEIWVKIDPFHLENALGNLIDNAIKYGGNEICVTLEYQGHQLSWKVSDNGHGIDKYHQKKIFEKFYRIPSGNIHDVKGFGIGLFYTRSIVENHGGQLELQSEKGNTVFIIKIPINNE